MRKKLAAILLSLSLLLGFGVVTAPAAQAVNYYNCYWRYGGYVAGLGTFYDRYCWADYSWWEEIFQAKWDRWERRGSKLV